MTAQKFRRLPAAIGALGLVLAGALTALGPGTSVASSHREAPMIAADPAVDNTDLYAFVSPDKPDTVTIIANYIPLEEPAGGPNFASFDDNVRYAINIDNDGDCLTDLAFTYVFSPKRNGRQTASVFLAKGEESRSAEPVGTLAMSGNNLPGCSCTILKGIERRSNSMKRLSISCLLGLVVCTSVLSGCAGMDRAAVDDHRARAARPAIAHAFVAGVIESRAHGIEQRDARRDADVVHAAVDRQPNRHLAWTQRARRDGLRLGLGRRQNVRGKGADADCLEEVATGYGAFMVVFGHHADLWDRRAGRHGPPAGGLDGPPGGNKGCPASR